MKEKFKKNSLSLFYIIIELFTVMFCFTIVNSITDIVYCKKKKKKNFLLLFFNMIISKKNIPFLQILFFFF